MLRPVKLLAAAGSLFFFLALADSVMADGVVFDGIGPITTGRGATNLGFADNAAIIMDNPAGMSNVAGEGLLEGGVDTCIPNLQYSDPQNNAINSAVRG